MKKSIKKLRSPLLNPNDKFHKSNTGTYYFPNGEVFRPRLTPSSRHRPSKVHGSRSNSVTKDTQSNAMLHYTPAAGVSEIPRTSSMVSVNSASSTTSPNPNSYVTKSSSLTNLRRSNMQHLAQSLRSNKIDTPTNINIQSFSSMSPASSPAHASAPTMPSMLTPPVQFTRNFQSANVLKDNGTFNENIFASGQPHHPPATTNNTNSKSAATSSDSNLSSLSNYNLNRSSSNTPQTSINTSIDIDEATEAYVKSIKNNESRSTVDDDLQKSSSLESIKEAELHSIDEVPRIDVQDSDSTMIKNQEFRQSLDCEQPVKLDEPVAEPVNDLVLQNEPHGLTEDSKNAFNEVEDTRHIIPILTKEDNNIDAPNEGTPQMLNNSSEDFINLDNDGSIPPDIEQGSEESDIIAEYSTESESDSEVEVLEKIPKPTLSMVEHSDSFDCLQEDSNCTTNQTNSDSEDLSTLHEASESATRVNPSMKSILHSEKSTSEEFQTPKGSPTPDNKEASSDIDKMKYHDTDTKTTLDNNDNTDWDPSERTDVTNQTDVVQEDETDHKSSSSISDSPVTEYASPRPNNFFDFHKNDAFDKFLNDNQDEVPPRGDVAVMGDKIRKHERSVSSISSFNSILYSELESPSKSKSLRSPIQSSSPRTPQSRTSSYDKAFVEHNRKPITEKSLPVTPTEESYSNEKSLPFKPIENLDASIPSNNVTSSKENGRATSLNQAPNNNVSKLPLKKSSMLDVITGDENISKASGTKGPKNIPKNSVPEFKAIPKVKSMNNMNNDVNKLKKSSSTANFKAFWKKLFPLSSTSSSASSTLLDKQTKGSQRSQTDISQESSSSNRFRKLSKGRRSFSLTNLRINNNNNNNINNHNLNHNNHNHNNKHNMNMNKNGDKDINKPSNEKEAEKLTLTSLSKIDENESIRDQNDFDSEIISNTEKLTITKLPTIERDDNLFRDMLTNFDEELNKVNSSSNMTSTNSINELFIKDDELTRDQIEDQQKKDNNQITDDIEEDNDSKSTSSGAFSIAPSEEIYIDDNIRFLRDELVWPIDNDEFKSIEDYSVLSRSGTVKTKLNPDNNEEHNESTVETIVVDNEQLGDLFDNLTELQRRKLPIHLKHISQFKDSKILEISIRKFESIPDLSNLTIQNKELNSILKKLLNSSHNNKKVQFSNKISINETFSPDLYKRYNKSVTQYTLNGAMEINKIKNELNSYKCNEMLVHEFSQNNTHFFY